MRELAYILWCLVHRLKPRTRVANDWVGSLWAYAGGGKLHVYGNSREAIEESLKDGYPVIELDVSLTADGVPVLSHEWCPNGVREWERAPTLDAFKNKLINGRFHSLTLEEGLALVDGRAWVSVDPGCVQASNPEFDLVAWATAHLTSAQRAKVIWQVIGVKQLAKFARGCPFGALHYVLDGVVAPENQWKIRWLAPVLRAYGVGSVSFQEAPITEGVVRAIGYLKAQGLRVSVAGCDDAEKFSAWRSVGVDCVNTRRILPNE